MMQAWKYYRALTLTTSETDYVVTLELDGDDLDFAKCRPDGLDVVFVQAGVMLARDVIAFNSASETATIKVRVPNCAAALRMYYGGEAVPNSVTALGLEMSQDFRGSAIGATMDNAIPLWSLAGQTATPDANDYCVVADVAAPRASRSYPVLVEDSIRTHTGDFATWASRVPHHRNNFFANGLWWRAYALTAGEGPFDIILEYSDDDGATWATAATITDGSPTCDAQWSFAYSPTLDRFSYGRNIQSANPGVFHDGWAWRQGRPHPDGTVTWDAAEQTVVATGNFVGDFAMDYDEHGHAWLGHGTNGADSGTSGDVQLIRNANTDGTWSNTSGFPITVQEGTTNDLFCVLAPIGDAMYVAVYVWNTDIEAQGYLIAADGTITSEGAVTALPVEASSGASAKVGRIDAISYRGEVYLGYQSSSQTIRVAKRSAGGTWSEVEIAGSSYITDAIASPRMTVLSDGLLVSWTGRAPSAANASIALAAFWMCRYDAANDIWLAPEVIKRADIDENYEHLMPSHTADPADRVLMHYLEDDNEEWSMLVDPKAPAVTRGLAAHLLKTDAIGIIGAAALTGWGAGYAYEWEFNLVSISTGGDTNDYISFTSTNSAQNADGFRVTLYGDGPDAGGSGPSIGVYTTVHLKLAAIELDRWYRVRVVVNSGGTSYDVYLDGVQIADDVTCSNNFARFRALCFSPHTGEMYFTNLTITRVAATEPVATISSERPTPQVHFPIFK